MNTITEKEKEELKEIISIYRGINIDIEWIESQMKILESKKDKMLIKIKETQEEETYLINKLIEKYGNIITPNFLKDILL